MEIATGLIYKNRFNDEVEIIQDNTRENEYTFFLELKNGNSQNYRRPLDKLNNYISFSFQRNNEIEYVTFSIQASDRCGHGTILLKALLEKIADYERLHSVNIHHIMGWLSVEDKKNHNWDTSIPFYLNFPNTLTPDNAKFGFIRAEIHIKDENSIQRNAIGAKVDIDTFINGNRDGYIVYYFS